MITPRKGAARTLVVKIRSIACATRFTAGQWRTAKGAALRLRVVSAPRTSYTHDLKAGAHKRSSS